jgi:hypothetical protein
VYKYLARFYLTVTIVTTGYLSVARADIDTPPPECTLQNYHYNDTECTVCGVDSENAESCYKRYSPLGYTYSCSTEDDWESGSGGSSGDAYVTEIWCRPSPGTKGLAGGKGGSKAASNGGCEVNEVKSLRNDSRHYTWLGLAAVFLLFAITKKRGFFQ